jgi:NDP-sugar pyrophosphorylase family protein
MIKSRELLTEGPQASVETKAVVLAAGEGTRLRPLTFTRPKPMVPLGPEPSIYYVLMRLAREGFDEIVIVVRGSLKNEIMDYLGDGSEIGLRITYEVEPDGLHIGTAGSLKLGEHLLDDTFLVAQSDTLTEIPLREAVDFHRKSEALATIVLTRVADPSDYGVAVLDEKNTITEFQEKPSMKEARSNLVSTGFYIMEPESIDYIIDNKWDFAKNLFPRLLELHKKLSGFVSDAFWVDIGNLEGYLRGVKWVVDNTIQSQNALATELPSLVMTDRTAHIGNRAQIIGPALIERDVTIEDEAKIGKYCVIKRNAHVSSGTLLERSAIMERVYIGRNCTITDSIIGQSAVLHENITISGSIIGPGCVVGDRVNVLSGSRVWPNVQIGADERVEGIVAAPLETAFYCYTNFGQYTGLLATSIEGFIEALEKSPMESIEFHSRRRDYEKWVRDVLALNELADDMEGLRRIAVTGEELRRGLIEVTKKWADAIESKDKQVIIAHE